MNFKHIDWASFDGPKDFDCDAVARAIHLLSVSDSAPDGRAAYSAVLTAIGNNHAGTLYPVAVGVAPLLSWFREQSPRPWARWAATEVLEDLRESFTAEAGYETMQLASGATVETDATVKLLAAHMPSASETKGSLGYPLRGVVRWLTEQQGGRNKPPPPAPWATAASVGSTGLRGALNSFVLNHATEEVFAAASGGWLFEGVNAPPDVTPGTTIYVAQGPQTVATFEVLGVVS